MELKIIKNLPRFFVYFTILVFVSCTPATYNVRDNFKPAENKVSKILIMPLDIELSELTAGGLKEPKADWTQAAKTHIMSALDKSMRAVNANIQSCDPSVETPEQARINQQLSKLHEVVGGTILIHKYIPAFNLPTKKDSFDWTLGGGVKTLKDLYDADYAMFIYIRDSYASGGRKALIVGAALLGVTVQGGAQRGFVSLVDLNTGDIVWFNRIARGHGDLRSEKPATETVTYLLKGCPL